MKIYSEKLNISTRGNNDIINISANLEKVLVNSKINDGVLTVFVVGSTVGITTIEYESGLLKDLPEFLENIAPMNKRYHHDNTWGDGNGYAHIRSAFIGTSLSIPVSNGCLESGTWQQIILIDFDNRPRQRTVICKIIGE